MQDIKLPASISVETVSENRAKIIMQPLHPGYGTTIGNTLRRVLLSSLPGSAVTAIKIKGADHEFSAVPDVKEDVVSIMLNIKKLRLISHSDEPVKLTLHAKGQKTVTAKDITKDAQVEIVNPDHEIATITTKSGELTMDLWVQNGRGYVPVESQEKKDLEIGTIEVDAIYSPVRTVNFTVQNVRVEQYTNYNSLTLDIETDGSITPEQAFKDSAQILVDHFVLLSGQAAPEGVEMPEIDDGESKKTAPVEAEAETDKEKE
ncbi:MAG: DNA-directed RNA polymerase subunit alpha [Candidatus Kerfeldbacteria bacterium RIFCSPHIGHO2_12_FULL_48_17]|uniref:DNA-directed RNA polymerase subunit alpha n=1 Tax=Candidatus Kerfeldbacteria bacterium RIFCSPHIGHO2_12_FULL_48_17 TaxID=1798542 RepID=A0A1G2B0H2_9BACT|nr:MAG: DNA-directed RNA polymerase subunit alpha [Candidatus Kerfeldbacteria bacterium RIFCSPHIGHO2_12_FULL_48_17]